MSQTPADFAVVLAYGFVEEFVASTVRRYFFIAHTETTTHVGKVSQAISIAVMASSGRPERQAPPELVRILRLIMETKFTSKSKHILQSYLILESSKNEF